MVPVRVTTTFYSGGYYQPDGSDKECKGANLGAYGWVGFVGCDCHNKQDDVDRHAVLWDACVRGNRPVEVVD